MAGPRNPLEELTNASYLIARSAVTQGISRASVLKAAADLRSFQQREIEGFGQRGGRPVACRPGCNHCCSGVAMGTPLELAALADHIQSNWKQPQIEALIARLREYCAELDRNLSETFARFRLPCPLLDDAGLCSSYSHRPVSCHGYASADPDLCRLWKEAAHPAYPIEPPNAEDARAQAVAAGASEAFVKSGVPSGLIPMAPVLLKHLIDAGPIEKIVSEPEAVQIEIPWRETLGAAVALQPEDPVVSAYEQRAAFEPPEAYLQTLSRGKTSHLLLRMVAPHAFRRVQEIQETRTRIEQAIEDALALENWDAEEAFDNLHLLNVVRDCYGGLPMRPVMERLGHLLNDKVAGVVAPDLLEPMGKRKPGKVRIGLASYRMHSGSPASWALGWVRNFDRSKFEATVINLAGDEDSDSYRFKDLADKYVRFDGDKLEIARRIRAMDLDYLIYPDLGDGGWNFSFAMFRLARRQAAAWGCPFTSGLQTIDDYLTAGAMEPEGADEHYTENLVRLPNTGFTYSPFLTGLQHATRQAFGLPDGHLILMAQSFSKWVPQRDEMIAKIASRSRNPLVVIAFSTPYQQRVFGARMERLGVRAIMLPKLSLPVFLRLSQLCDVSLDPPDFSGGHTTFGLLQVGTPIVTMAGEFMRGRQGMVHATIAGAPGLIARDEDDYVDLATNPGRLRDAIANLDAAPLFNDTAPVRALEEHILSTSPL